MFRSLGPTHCPRKLTYRMQRPNLEIGDLPEDVLYRVFSKLQFNEVVRTSVLSSNWRHRWTIASKLNLDCIAICGRHRYFCGKQKYTQGYIDGVNTLLQQLHGKVVEALEVPLFLENICSFSQLKFLRLFLFVSCYGSGNILKLASLL